MRPNTFLYEAVLTLITEADKEIKKTKQKLISVVNTEIKIPPKTLPNQTQRAAEQGTLPAQVECVPAPGDPPNAGRRVCVAHPIERIRKKTHVAIATVPKKKKSA